MYKNTLALIAALIISTNLAAQSQLPVAETPNGPVVLNLGPVNPNTPDAMWDIRYQFNPTAISGSVSLAGIAFLNGEYWVSRWNNDSIYTFDVGGALTAGFTIPGLASATSGTRSMTTDGANSYHSWNSTNIKKVDYTTQSVVGTITMPALTGSTSGLTTTRFCTYDPTANGGAGGFWIGNFNTDLMLVSMTGTVLSTIPQISHGLTAMYGAAWDGTTPGGPYLWVHTQEDPAGGASLCVIAQVDITGGFLTGVQHDVDADLGATGGIAGGAFIGTIPGYPDASLGCLDQGVEVIFYEFLPTSVNELSKDIHLGVFPNPNDGNFSVKLVLQNADDITVQMTDIFGKVVLDQQYSKVTTLKQKYSLDNVSKGNYLLKVTTSKGTATQMVVIR